MTITIPVRHTNGALRLDPDSTTRGVSALITLSAVRAADYETFYSWYADIVERRLWIGGRTIPAYDTFVEDLRRKQSESLLVALRAWDTKDAIGMFQLYDIAARDGTASFLLYIAAPSRSVGIGQLAGREALSYAFASYPLRKIYADVYGFNTLSSSLLTSSGFHDVGALQDYIWWVDRRWSLNKYEISRPDFDEMMLRYRGVPHFGAGGGLVPTKLEAQFLDVALSGALVPSPALTAALDRILPYLPDALGEESVVFAFCETIFKHALEYSEEEGYPGIATWSVECVRRFICPTGHELAVERDESGEIVGGITYSCGTESGSVSARIWWLASRCDMESSVRDATEVRLLKRCAQDIAKRGGQRLSIYLRAGSPHASRIEGLLRAQPKVLPFHSVAVVNMTVDQLSRL